MPDIELLISWIGSLLILTVLFIVLNKRTRKARPVSLALKVIVVGLCFHINVIFSLLLYEPIMEVFDISIDGFMNLNGILTLAIIWLILASVVFAIAKAAKEQLGSYYKTIRNTQMALIMLPFLIVLLLLFAISLK